MENRSIRLDLIRCIAVFEVISVHFFLNNGFYNQTIYKPLFNQICFRTLFMTCVPLFMILTGYLMNKKELNKQYYSKIGRVLIIYLYSSVACLIYYFFIIHKEPFSIKFSVLKILNFSAAPYSWYINMYIGLFLIIPFLNILYNGLKNKNQKRFLLFIFIFVTVIPSIVNIYNFRVSGWFLSPNISEDRDILMTDWWTCIYPITYYFIGCYIREFNKKIKIIPMILLFIISFIGFGWFNYYRSYGRAFDWGLFTQNNGFQSVILSVLIFIIILNIRVKLKSNVIKKIITNISKLSLSIYLVSWIFDDKIYTYLRQTDAKDLYGMDYYIYIVPLIFILSIVVAIIVQLMYKLTIFLYSQNNLFVRNKVIEILRFKIQYIKVKKKQDIVDVKLKTK